jgi:hypothetical protein
LQSGLKSFLGYRKAVCQQVFGKLGCGRFRFYAEKRSIVQLFPLSQKRSNWGNLKLLTRQTPQLAAALETNTSLLYEAGYQE